MKFRSLCALLALRCNATVSAATSVARPLVFCADTGREGFEPGPWNGASTSDGRADFKGARRE